MQIRKTARRQLIVDWNFARDGGAVGAVGVGGFLPINSFIVNAELVVTSAINGNGIINFGITGLPSMLGSAGAPLPFNTNTNTSVLLLMTISSSIIFTVQIDPVTSGSAICIINYQEFSLT